MKLNYKLKDLPKEERPRERLLEIGVRSLTNTELLSIILKTGTKDKNVKDLALDIMSEYKDFSKLKDASVSKLMNIKGIGKVKAIEIISAIELGRRVFLEEKHDIKKVLKDAKSIWKDSKYLFKDKKQECFYCLYFNNKQELIERKLLFMGTINRSIVHPREIFKEAYLLSASSIVCMHNHPSGDVNPSMEDRNFTRSLMEIGKLQGIPILDHIIVSDDNYYSFYENMNIL